MTKKRDKSPRRGHRKPTDDKDSSVEKVQLPTAGSEPAADDYKVGPGCPPKEYQFKTGKSGNPKGRPKKDRLGTDLKQALERSMNKKATVTEGDRKRVTTWAQAGLEKLVHQYAQGDRHARRDLFWIAERLGIDIRGNVTEVNSAQQEIAKTLFDSYIGRRIAEANLTSGAPVLAAPELLDDDDAGSE